MTHPDSHHPALFEVPSVPRQRTSAVLLSLAVLARHEELTLRVLTRELGDRTFGMLLVLLAVFNLIPLVSIVAGVLVAVLGLQMAAGLTRARLPAFILDRRLPAERVRHALLAFTVRLQQFEHLIRPRWQFSEAPIVDRVNGVMIAALGVVIAIPLPLTNLAPAMVVAVMGLGLIERDGLVQLVALVAGLMAIAVIAFFVLG